MNDSNLKTLLIYCLAVGNFLNGDGARGDSWGFRISDFIKLDGISSNIDSNKNIIEFIVEDAEK